VRLEVSEGLVELVARARREGWDRRQDLLVPMGVGRLGGIDVVDGPADPTELEERSLGCVAVSNESSRSAGREGVQQAVWVPMTAHLCNVRCGQQHPQLPRVGPVVRCPGIALVSPAFQVEITHRDRSHLSVHVRYQPASGVKLPPAHRSRAVV